MQKLGINDLRQGNIANAREGFKQNELETKFSMSVTGYVYRMIQYQKERIATTTLQLAQDIIKFGESIPYKWIRKLVGEENFENLKVIKDFSAHRFGIIVQDINIEVEKKRINEAADLALDKGDGRGGLSFDQWFMITQTSDFKQAAKLLTFLKLKLDKKVRKEKLEDAKIAQQNIMQQKQMENDAKDKEYEFELSKTKMLTEATKYVADKSAESKIQIKDMGLKSEPIKQDDRTQSDKEIIKSKADAAAQEALT